MLAWTFTGALFIAHVTQTITNVALLQETAEFRHVDRSALHQTAGPVIPHETGLTEKLPHLGIGQPLRTGPATEKEEGQQCSDQQSDHVAPQSLGERHDAKMGDAPS